MLSQWHGAIWYIDYTDWNWHTDMSFWSALEIYHNTATFFFTFVIPTEIPVLLKLKPFSLLISKPLMFSNKKKLHLGRNTTQKNKSPLS